MKIFWIQDVNYGDLDYKEDILSVLGLSILFQVEEPFVILALEKFTWVLLPHVFLSSIKFWELRGTPLKDLT